MKSDSTVHGTRQQALHKATIEILDLEIKALEERIFEIDRTIFENKNRRSLLEDIIRSLRELRERQRESA